MRIISCIVGWLKGVINKNFYKVKDGRTCKSCRYRSNKDVMTTEVYTYTRNLKESCTYFCTRHNRYVTLEENCHDYDRD
ncbi:MAG: hypothetical protein IKK43_05160 [Clostridia bacterium]|nr:hypothetical protein [Clostridia bacterium]